MQKISFRGLTQALPEIAFATLASLMMVGIIWVSFVATVGR